MHRLTALEQAAAIAAGDLDPLALTEHYLARIEAKDPILASFVTVTAEAARETARSRPPSTSVLSGVPTALKDLTLTRGTRTTMGSRVFTDFVPGVDSDTSAAVRAAGLPVLGKTTTPEFGCTLYTETDLGPPTRNPWALEYSPGGSSGGAAAAVAAGLVPVAHGTDGGGSIRIPAALCGLVGYKPSRGVVPGGPLGFGGFGLPTGGAIGRTVADCAALVTVLAAPVPGQPYPSPVTDLPALLAAALAAERAAGAPRSLRIGRFVSPELAGATVGPDCVAAVDTLTATLTTLGHEVVEIPSPFDGSVFELFQVVWAALAAVPLPAGGVDLLRPLTRWLYERGTALSARDLMAALTELQTRVRVATARTAGFDLLLCPTLAGTRARIGEFAAAGDPADDFAAQARFSPYCALFNLTGGPAISLPVHQTADGLPVGAMLAAAPGADALLLAVAGEVERAAPWSHRHPEIWYDPPGR